MTFNHAREDQLLLLLAPPCRSEPDRCGISDLLREPLDWGYFTDRSRNEGLSCLIFRHSRDFIDAFPAEVLERLRRIYYANMARNLALHEETKKIVKAFHGHNIQSMVFKGVSLAQEIYKNIAMRPATDTDLLIRRQDLAQADAILQSLGYRSPACFRDFLDADQLTSLNSLLYVMPDCGPARRFPVHLHWHLINSTWPLTELVRDIDMQRIWSAARSVTLDETMVWTLCPEHLLIYLSHHALNHNFEKLILAADIREVIAAYEQVLDWERLKEDMAAFGLTGIVLKSLEFAGSLLNFDIPQLGIKPGKSRRGYGLSYFVYLTQCQGWSNRARFIYRTVAPDRLIIAQSLGIPLREVRFRHYWERMARRLLVKSP